MIYRNIYVKGFKKFPYILLRGRVDLCYTGKIICGVDKKPDECGKKDLYIGCDCDFKKWRRLKRIIEK